MCRSSSSYYCTCPADIIVLSAKTRPAFSTHASNAAHSSFMGPHSLACAYAEAQLLLGTTCIPQQAHSPQLQNPHFRDSRAKPGSLRSHCCGLPKGGGFAGASGLCISLGRCLGCEAVARSLGSSELLVDMCHCPASCT